MKFLIALALFLVTPAFAQQVPAPLNAPASVTSGHALCATASRQQTADCGAAPGTVTDVTASAPLSSSGGATPNLAITSPLPTGNGGTGVANAGGSTLTLGGAVVFAGANTVTLTSTGTTNATLPGGTKTLADLSDAQTFTATQTFTNATAAVFDGGCIAVGQVTCNANDPIDIASTTTGGIRIANSVASALNNDIRLNSSGNSALFGIGGASYSANPIATARAVFAGNGADVVVWTIGANNILFATGGGATSNERARITSTGTVGIGTTSPKATLDVNGGVRAAITTVSGLPSCSATNEGESRGVSDATATTFASTLAGGGGNHVPVYCNGSNWIVG